MIRFASYVVLAVFDFLAGLLELTPDKIIKEKNHKLAPFLSVCPSYHNTTEMTSTIPNCLLTHNCNH